MFSPSIIVKSSLERRTIAADKLIPTIQNHLRRVGAFGRQPRSIDALPFGKHWQGIWIFPAEIVPVSDVLTDTDYQLSRVRLLQIDLPEEGVGRWATRTSFRSKKFYDRNRGRRGVRNCGRSGMRLRGTARRANENANTGRSCIGIPPAKRPDLTCGRRKVTQSASQRLVTKTFPRF